MGQSPDGTTYSDTPSDYILVQGNADLVDGWVSPRIWTTQKTKTCSAGDLIMSVRAPAGTMGKTAYNAVIGRGVASIKGNEFVFQQLSKMDNDGFWKKDSSGSTFESLNSDSIKNAEISLPREVEQVKIGSLFKNLDHLITLHQRKLIFLKSHRFLMSVLFCYSWEQRKLGDIGKTFTGLSGKTSDDFGHGDAKFLPYLNIFNNPIADINFLESTEIDKSQNEIKYGDVFFTTSSETPEEVGMSSVWLGNSENIYLNSFCFGFRPLIDFNPYYFGYLLRSDTFRNPVTILAQGISRFNISKNKVMEIEIPLPEKQEQEKIGQLFYKLDYLITLHQRK